MKFTGASTSSDSASKEPIGSWLCAEGPYREYIQALCSANPGLRRPDPNNGPLQTGLAQLVGGAQVVLLDTPAVGLPKFQSTEFANTAALRTHFHNSSHDHARRRIYIMEGLAPETVAAVGGHFFMPPTFFQRHERTCVWSTDFTPVSDALPQPSLLDPETSFHLQYCELRQFNKALENRPYFCERTRRHVGMTAPRHEEETTTGILRRKVSWWCRTTSRGGWDVVILCDPQLLHLSPHPKEISCTDKTPRLIENVYTELKNEPFQGGYADFLPTLPYNTIGNKPDHPQKSMRYDLIHYYKHHADVLPESQWQTPQPSAMFIKKIVAAQYLQLVDYIKVMLPSFEVRLTTAWVEEQDQWKSLQIISRRCGNYRDDIEDALLSLGYRLNECTSVPSPSLYSPVWQDCEIDFRHAYYRLKVLKERADNLMQAMTGLASIAGNRQNLQEAKHVKRLNILALLFIPLTYTSGLFSMESTYAPQGPHFWIYWVTAIGAVILTAIITWSLDNALNDAAQWTLAPLRWMTFFRNKQPCASIRGGAGTRAKRKDTGFYS